MLAALGVSFLVLICLLLMLGMIWLFNYNEGLSTIICGTIIVFLPCIIYIINKFI